MRTASGATLDAKRLLALVAALAVGVALWDTPVLWPLKLLVVMMHESGHALATLAVGGSVDSITIASNESGACLSRLPRSTLGIILVYSAGYVGSAVAGGLMLLATYRFRLRRAVLWAACVWLGVTAFVYAGDWFTRLFCLGTALALGLCARYLPDAAVEVLNLFIAAFSALYVVFDLRDDLWNERVRNVSDAALLAEHTFIPAIVWAVLWTLFSLFVLGAAAWSAIQRGRKLESTPDYLRGRIR